MNKYFPRESTIRTSLTTMLYQQTWTSIKDVLKNASLLSIGYRNGLLSTSNMNSKLKCTRQGCKKEYIEEENTETSCIYHDGKPIFHDCKRGWTCCDVVVYDWDEFMKIPGCKVGKHTNEEEEKTEFFKSQTVSNAQKGIDNAEKSEQATVIKDIKEFEKEQAKIEEEKRIKKAEQPREILKTKDGKYYCGNPGCTEKTYDPESNGDNSCQYHAGNPTFHDRKKFWTCCKQEAYDWDDFLLLKPCVVGKHVPKYKN